MKDTEEFSNWVNDIYRGFRAVFPSQESMRQQMVEIAKHSSYRVTVQDYVSKMRFLIKHHSEDEDIPSHQSSVIEAAAAPVAFPATSSPATSPSGAVLKLADRSILADPEAYIAVSCCWSKKNIEWFTNDIEAPIEVLRNILVKGQALRPSMSCTAMLPMQHNEASVLFGSTGTALTKMIRSIKKMTFKLWILSTKTLIIRLLF